MDSDLHPHILDCWFLTGATASGKTSTSIQLAKAIVWHFPRTILHIRESDKCPVVNPFSRIDCRWVANLPTNNATDRRSRDTVG